jgi:hypothetical protein
MHARRADATPTAYVRSNRFYWGAQREKLCSGLETAFVCELLQWDLFVSAEAYEEALRLLSQKATHDDAWDARHNTCAVS